MSILVNYISKLFKHWIIYLGFIPGVYDLFNAYLSFDFEFPKYFIIGFPIFVFMIAIYQVYKEEYLLRISLEKKLQGPTSYEITAVLTPIDFKEKNLLQKVDKVTHEAEKKLNTIPPHMNITEFDKYNQIMKSISSMALYKKTPVEYNTELSKYKRYLEKIIENAETKKKQIHEAVKLLNNKYYRIVFHIKNTGITSDSEIQVSIECLENNVVFNETDIFQYGVNIYQLIPKLPIAPEKPTLKQTNLINATVLERDYSSLMPHIENPNAFRKWIEIQEQNCSVTIKELHVGDKVNLFNKNLVSFSENEIKFKVTIKSKKSTRVLYPETIMKKDSNKIALFNPKDN